MEHRLRTLDRVRGLQVRAEVDAFEPWTIGKQAGCSGIAGAGHGQERRKEVDEMRIGRDHPAGVSYALGPVHDERSGGAALEGVVLVVAKGRVGDIGPIVAEGRPASHRADRMLLADLPLPGFAGYDFRGGAVIGGEQDQRFVEFP